MVLLSEFYGIFLVLQLTLRTKTKLTKTFQSLNFSSAEDSSHECSAMPVSTSSTSREFEFSL